MAWTDEDGYTWATPKTWAVGNPATQKDMEEIAENQSLLLGGKTAFLPGKNPDCVAQRNESGAFFAMWNYMEAGEEKILVNLPDYEGILAEYFTTNGGKNRTIDASLSWNCGMFEADVQAMMPGEVDDHTVFDRTGGGNGSAPETVRFYSSSGGAGGNYVGTITSDNSGEGGASGFLFKFFVDSGDGDICLNVEKNIGDFPASVDWVAFMVIVTIGPKLSKAS